MRETRALTEEIPDEKTALVLVVVVACVIVDIAFVVVVLQMGRAY